MSVVDCLLENEPDLIAPSEWVLHYRRKVAMALITGALFVAVICWVAMVT